MRQVLSGRTRRYLKFDALRLRARLLSRLRTPPAAGMGARLHVGCGKKRVAGWINIDVIGSDFDVDLAAGKLPWPAGSFASIVSQQVIEHLDLATELLPLLREFRRVLAPGAEAWLACPDLGRVCADYAQTGGRGLLEDKQSRWPSYSIGDAPPQQAINVWFHQSGEHKNLFDFELLRWALVKAGFSGAVQVVEADLLARFPEFPPRKDDRFSLYVKATA